MTCTTPHHTTHTYRQKVKYFHVFSWILQFQHTKPISCKVLVNRTSKSSRLCKYILLKNVFNHNVRSYNSQVWCTKLCTFCLRIFSILLHAETKAHIWAMFLLYTCKDNVRRGNELKLKLCTHVCTTMDYIKQFYRN